MDTTRYLQDHLEAYRLGHRDRAFFGLINRGESLLPDLVKALSSETDPEVRAFIVDVLWQQRDPRAIPALSDALNDPDDRVWQEALNGLVTLASTESVEALKMTKARTFRSVPERDRFITWLEEAIEQAEEALRR